VKRGASEVELAGGNLPPSNDLEHGGEGSYSGALSSRGFVWMLRNHAAVLVYDSFFTLPNRTGQISSRER